jgi:hypothetical protein
VRPGVTELRFNERSGTIEVMQQDSLIRISVLSNLLVKALTELDDEGFASPQLQDELREIGRRAAAELDQPSLN